MQTIPRRLSRCILGSEPFLPGTSYLSVLDEEGNRKDYCLSCAEKIEKPSGDFWKGTIPPKKDKTSIPDLKALELFRITDEPKLKFVLALYLQRKQQLMRRTSTLYEAPETGEVFDVENVQLTPEEGQQLALTLDRLLHEPSTS